MKTKNQTQRIQDRIARVQRALAALGPIHPGSLSRQYNVCGKAGCRCKDPANPRRHGPYYKISYVYHGHFTSRFVPRDAVSAVRSELANYKRLRRLVDVWVGLAVRLAKERRQSGG
jgi:Family of unknown function (DUF6788)